MSNKLFLPFLTNDQGSSLDIENSVVIQRSLPTPLENSPEGWENNTIQFSRNTEFRGVIKAYITNLKFFLEGATILRNAFYKQGMETILYFIWLKQNRAFGAGMKYESWYKGEPDFGTFKDEYVGVEINITEGGYYKDLQANKGIVYDIPFDNDAVYVYMDGMNLNNVLHYEIQDGFGTTVVPMNYIYMPLTFLTADGSSAGVISYSQIGEDGVGTPSYTDPKYFLGTTVAFTPHFVLSIKFNVRDFPLNISFFLHTQTRQYDISPDTAYPIGDHVLDFEFDFAVNPGENIYFMAHSVSNGLITFKQSDFLVTTITREPANIVQAFRAVALGQKVTSKVSKAATLTSPLLDPDFNLLITCGDAIRNIPNAVVKTSWTSYFKSIDAVKCASLRVTDGQPVIVSRYDDFDKSKTIGSLGECSNWVLEPADDYIYDSVEAGYPPSTTGSNIDVNGKYSFNNTFNWGLDITRRKVNKYSAKADYFADPYDIELIRVNFNQKDTTTANSDNNVFFLDCEIKSDLNYIGPAYFDAPSNSIYLSGDISAIEKFLVAGVKLVVTGSENNDRTFTIKQVLSIISGVSASLILMELVSVSESATITITTNNIYQLRRKFYNAILGIPNDGTVFNIELSPRRILDNHLRWIRSSCDHLDTNKLVLLTTDKNKYLVTYNYTTGVSINEAADIVISSMGPKVYLPYLVKFNVQSPENLLNSMADNVGGKFNFTREGLAMEGYPIDIKTDDTELTEQEFDLLLTDNNDLTQLIR